MAENIYDRLSFFQDLNPDQSALVRSLFWPCNDPAGTVIFEQGDLAEHLYIVVEGEVNIRYKPEDGPAINVTRVRTEGVVGWSAAIGNPTYTSSAICATDCLMLRMRGQDLRRFCDKHPDTGMLVLERLAEVIAERLRNTHHHVIALLQQGMHVNMDKQVTAG